MSNMLAKLDPKMAEIVITRLGSALRPFNNRYVHPAIYCKRHDQNTATLVKSISFRKDEVFPLICGASVFYALYVSAKETVEEYIDHGDLLRAYCIGPIISMMAPKLLVVQSPDIHVAASFIKHLSNYRKAAVEEIEFTLTPDCVDDTEIGVGNTLSTIKQALQRANVEVFDPFARFLSSMGDIEYTGKKLAQEVFEVANFAAEVALVQASEVETPWQLSRFSDKQMDIALQGMDDEELSPVVSTPSRKMIYQALRLLFVGTFSSSLREVLMFDQEQMQEYIGLYNQRMLELLPMDRRFFPGQDKEALKHLLGLQLLMYSA